MKKSIPKFFAKSALQRGEIASKERSYNDGIEIQLLSELVNGEIENYSYALETFDLKEFEDVNITAVHAPILSAYGLSDVNIETLCCSNNFKLLDQTCFIANYFGQIHKRQTIVIIHSESCLLNMRLNDDNWKRVLNAIGCLLLKYPYIEIAIENVTPLRGVDKGRIHLANNFQFDNVEMALELRKQLKTTRIGTVLDTCHAEMTNMTMSAILNFYKEEHYLPENDFSMEDFFRENKDVVKLIHLSKTVGSGMGEGRHGQPFNDGDEDIIKKYLDLYNKYEYTCPITLEVAETDYYISDGYAKSIELVLKYFN